MEAFLSQLPVFLLVASRMGGLMITSPIFNNRFLVPQVRAFLTFLLAFLLLPRATAPPQATEGAWLIVSAVAEMLTGMVIGFLTLVVLSTMAMAGALIDLDMGFTIAQVMDPVTGHAESVLGSFIQSLTLVVFFGFNAHHWLIRALAQSYDAIPVGLFTLQAVPSLHLVEMFGALLSLTIQMVLPFIAVMLLVTTALAGMNRAVPQFNLFAIGLGTKALVGMLFLFLIFPYLLPRLEWLFEAGHAELLKLIELMRP